MKQNKCGGWNQRRPIAKIYVWALGWSRTHCLNDSKWAKPVWRFQTERGALALRSVLAYCSEIVSFNQAKPFSDCPPHVSKHTSFAIFCQVLLRVSKTFVMQQSKLGKHFSIESSEAFCKTLQPTLWGRHTHVGGSIKLTSRLDGKIWNLHSVPCATMHPWRVFYMHGTPPEMNDESIITHHFPSQENRARFIPQNRIWLISRRK